MAKGVNNAFVWVAKGMLEGNNNPDESVDATSIKVQATLVTG